MELRPERLKRIVQLLKQRGGVRTNELAEELGVSAATVRRDLEDLAARGLVDRAHGGAVILRSGTDKEAPFAERAPRMRAEKERISAGARSISCRMERLPFSTRVRRCSSLRGALRAGR